MCGIAGIFYSGANGPTKNIRHQKVLELLQHRGPDFQAFMEFKDTKLYHSRLQIVDTTNASNQPFTGEDKKQALVFNGEIFNYREFQKSLAGLNTSGDVEVLFRLLKNEGRHCLDKLNGFFAFAFYDETRGSLLVAKDRLGVKPLYYYRDGEKFVFASELKPLLEITGRQELNYNQVYTYFRLNYCSGNETIFKNVYRLLPGQYIEISRNGFEIDTWYLAPKKELHTNFADLLDDAVKIRLNADVPLGTFLSGGLDSSIISALAKKHKPDLKTFSIGFEKETYFDETKYSELVAAHIGSDHHVLRLKEDDLLNNIDEFLDCIDEPFADSSAFNFYMLSKYTKEHVKVALSGDGADELFKGYNKHRALLLCENKGSLLLAKTLVSAFKSGKSSREGAFKNKFRQLKKFSSLAGLSEKEKQEFLSSISTDEECKDLLLKNTGQRYFKGLFSSTAGFANFDIEDSFDLQTVLADDMLVKADRFSMRHGIEIRNPFLDYRVLEFALNLDKSQKIRGSSPTVLLGLRKAKQKIILKKTFKDLLPAEIFSRSKKGFELPLHKWLTNNLRTRLENEWLNREKIESRGILNYAQVQKMKGELFSTNPGDSAARLWAVIVFESWMENFGEYIK